MLQWWLEIQPDDARIGVSVDVSLQRVTWWSSGAPREQLETIRHYLTEGGASKSALGHFEESTRQLGAQTMGSWVELTTDRVGGGWFLPDTIATSAALPVAAASPAREALAKWTSATDREICAGVVRSAFGSQHLTEWVLPLTETHVRERVSGARDAFAALGVPVPGDGILDVVSQENAAALAVHVCLSPVGVTRAGVVVPGTDTRLMLALAGRAKGFQAADLADFEAALQAGRSMVLVDRTDLGLAVEVYYAF